jgi:Domain of unknown function (DUF3597)
VQSDVLSVHPSRAAKLTQQFLALPKIRANSSPSKQKSRTGSVKMSIFGKIMGAIFGTAADATGSGAKTIDVAPILDKAVAAQKEKLEWRTSIVDLMKALNIESSFGARKELAKELGYTGDMNDSANMNIWLHKQVMAKLAANGGIVPDDLKH